MRTFQHNHPGTNVVDGPIEGLDPAAIRKQIGLARGELDVIVGGPPCQGFSINAPERFQSFPDRYIFLGSRVAQYEQVGNAVPPLMARSLAETIREHIARTALRNAG